MAPLSRLRSLGKPEFTCQRCGTCCLNVFPLFHPDLSRLENRINLSKMRGNIKVYLSQGQEPPKGIRLFLDAGDPSRPTSSPNRCPFLDSENACTIYEDRPLACRRFPIGDKPGGKGICKYWTGRPNEEMKGAERAWQEEERKIRKDGAENYYKRWLSLLYPKGYIPPSAMRQGVFWTDTRRRGF
jgi:Fe-S-cluster containining protein